MNQPQPAPNPSVCGSRPCAGAWAALAVILALAGAVRWGRLDVPMERDEGEYAYAGQLILQGVPPYHPDSANNMKLPGIYLAYAGIMGVFGQTIRGVHLGLLVVNLASIVLVWRIGRRLMDDAAGLGAAAGFAALSLHPSVTGLFANAEHFVVLPMLGGVLMLLRARNSGRAREWLAAGVLMGAAFIVKQHGIAFVAFGGLLLIVWSLGRRPIDWRAMLTRVAWYAAGAATPFALVCAWMAIAGVFGNFWFWTFTYAAEYVSQTTFRDGMAMLSHQLSSMGGWQSGLWALAALGAASAVWDAPIRRCGVFLVLLCACSMLATCPGWLFRNHYFLFVLPAAALLIGAAATAGQRLVRRWASPGAAWATVGAAFVAAIGAAIHGQWDEAVRLPNDQAARAIYGANPFPESVEIARYLRSNTMPSDTIAVIGSEPQIYFYAGRRAATGHIYTYALMEEHPFAGRMQREMISQIEKAAPKFILFVNVRTSWLPRPGSDMTIFQWMERHLQDHYEQAGLVNIGQHASEYHWEHQARGRQPTSPFWIGVYRRKTG